MVLENVWKSARARVLPIAGAGLFLIALADVGPLAAQDFSYGRRLYQDKAQCSFRHGWAGDGAGEPQSNGGAVRRRRPPLTQACFQFTRAIEQRGRGTH